MPERRTRMLIAGILLLGLLTACSDSAATQDWMAFAIEEEPAIDITFRLPPSWYVDYAPTPDVPGQWDVALVPPRCSADQEQDFEDNCIALTVQIKGTANFNKNEFLTLVSEGMSLNQSGSEESVLMGQKTFEVNGLTMQRFNHKVYIGEEEIQMAFIFFETDSAYYYFTSEFPYAEREGETARQFELLINSIEVLN